MTADISLIRQAASRVRRRPLLRRFSFLVLLLTSLSTSCGHRTAYRIGGTAPTHHSHVVYRLLLIGDAGYSRADSQVLAAIRTRAQVAPEVTTVVYLGDNIYPAGLPPLRSAYRSSAEARLEVLIDALRETHAETIFLPGNHDWDNSGPDGWNAIRRQQAFIEQRSQGRSRLLPERGMPGPVCEDKPGARLVLLDTQWWLHAYSRPARNEQEVLDALATCLRTAGELPVVVLAHHPLQSYGLHGGEATVQDHMFPLSRLRSWLWAPLPMLGSAYVWARRFGASNQDLSGAKNRYMVSQLERVLRRHNPLLFAAGHDHNLQVLRGTKGSAYAVVSGSGSATTDVGRGPDTLFAQQALGFIEIEFTRAARAVLTVHSALPSGVVRPQWRFVLK